MNQKSEQLYTLCPEKKTGKTVSLPFFLVIISLFYITFTGCSLLGKREIQGMVYIPAGNFIIGSNETDELALAKEFGSRHGVYFENEKPQRTIKLKEFYIDTFEVTNKEYHNFLKQTGYRQPEHWIEKQFEAGKTNHPVNYVTWHDANTYCDWADKRLPAEEEWEKASRGPKGNKYPWGNLYDEKKGNLSKGHTVAVGTMKQDRSYYGVFDLGGNVMEWTASYYKAYPNSTFQSKDFGKKNRVIRGGYGSTAGHYSMGNVNARGAFRNFFKPDGKGFDVGFRCAKDY